MSDNKTVEVSYNTKNIMVGHSIQVRFIGDRYAFEKDKEYQQTGTYLHPSQTIERNLHRSFLRFQVDEQGKVSMTSIYCGHTSIHHTSVKVTAPDGTFVQTPASPDSYETTDLDEHIEKADYKLGQDGGVMHFIADNQNSDVWTSWATVPIPPTSPGLTGKLPTPYWSWLQYSIPLSK